MNAAGTWQGCQYERLKIAFRILSTAWVWTYRYDSKVVEMCQKLSASLTRCLPLMLLSASMVPAALIQLST